MSGVVDAGLGVLPDGHIARPRLVRQMAGSRVAVVHAHGGWGKSTLALEAADRHRGEVVWIDLRREQLPTDGLLRRLLDPLALESLVTEDREPDDLSGAVRRAMQRRRTPTLVVVDEVLAAHWPALDVLLDGLPPPHRAAVLSRQSPPAEVGDHPPAEATVLRTADLAFSQEEFLLLLSEQVPHALPRLLAEQLHQATAGWPTALRSLVGALARSTAPAELGRRLLQDNVVLETLVHQLLQPLDAGKREALGLAAVLPSLDARFAVQLGLVDAVSAAQEAGLPWETPPVGPWTVPEPVAELLMPHGALPEASARAVADVYVRHDRFLDAARVALDHGHPDLAASVLAEAPISRLGAAFKPSVVALVQSLPDDVVRAHPWLDVQVARLLSKSARYQARNEHVLARLPDHADRNPEVAVALEAERFRDLAYFSVTPDPEDIARIESLLTRCEDQGTRSRLEQGLALLLARRDGVAAAEAGLRRAAEAAERAGDDTQAVLALRDLAWVVLLEQGRLRQVVETFDRVEQMLGPDTRLTSWRINRADTLLYLGDLDAAERDLDIAARLAELHHDDQHVSYAAWARATLESMRGERLRTLAAVERAEAMAGDWVETVTGVLFHAQCADALARVGLESEARERLARAQARRADDERAVRIAEASVEARLGDPARASAIIADLALDELEPFEVPRILLLSALALHRAGRPATEAACRAFVAFEAQGLLESAPVLERQACEVLAPLAEAEGAPVPTGSARPEPATPRRGAMDLAAVLQHRHGLRPREVEVLLALRTGGTNADIAGSLGISTATVRKHLQHAYATLDVRSRTEALVLLGRLAEA